MAAVAQGVINITEAADPKRRTVIANRQGAAAAAALNRIEKGSLIHRGMAEITNRETEDIAKLREALHLLRLDGRAPDDKALVKARGIILDLFNARTDPEWEPDNLEAARGDQG